MAARDAVVGVVTRRVVARPEELIVDVPTARAVSRAECEQCVLHHANGRHRACSTRAHHLRDERRRRRVECHAAQRDVVLPALEGDETIRREAAVASADDVRGRSLRALQLLTAQQAADEDEAICARSRPARGQNSVERGGMVCAMRAPAPAALGQN
eukprot:2068055-Prymnesium_polylepis.4